MQMKYYSKTCFYISFFLMYFFFFCLLPIERPSLSVPGGGW